MLGPRPPTRKKTKGKATLGPCWSGGMLGRGILGMGGEGHGMFGGEGGGDILETHNSGYFHQVGPN